MKNHNFKHFILDIIKITVPTLLGFILGYFTFHQQFDATEKGKLNTDLNQLLVINMQYSFVEDSTFIARWDKHKVVNRDSSLKYDAYCAYVFNLIENTAEYFHYDKSKISGFLDINDLISQHKQWWLRPEQKNSESYPDEFKTFIRGYIK